MPATLATSSAILKEIYEPRVRKQLNDEAVTLKRIERSSEGVENTVGGKYVTFGIKTRRNSGIGARNEMELLPTPGQQGYNAARVGLKYLYGRIQLSGQAIKLAESNVQAFTNVLDGEVSGLATDLAKDQNRQVFGNGTGAFATLTAVMTAATTGTVKSALWAQLGEQVDIIDGTAIAAGTTKKVNAQITNINLATNVITIDTAATAAVGDIFVRTGNVNREWTGLAKIVANSGTLYNVDPNTEPVWKAEVDSNAGTNRALSEGLMINMADRIRVNGGKVTLIVGNLGVRRAYFNLLSQQRQFVNTTEFKGGFKGLAFTTDSGEIPMISDIDAPLNTLWFLNEDELTLYREADWSWMDMDGSRWNRVAGYDAYEATMYQYSEIGCHRRNSFGVIMDVTEG